MKFVKDNWFKLVITAFLVVVSYFLNTIVTDGFKVEVTNNRFKVCVTEPTPLHLSDSSYCR